MDEAINRKLTDLYGISKAEAKYYWIGRTYLEVLQHKIELGNKLQKKLLDTHLMKRDGARVTRVGNELATNYNLLREIT